MTNGQQALSTYRYLRWLLILLPAVLFFVTIATALRQGALEPSISAYYGGPVRDVFVGVMIGTAACMVAYKGASRLEDYTLNAAGFYAVFVALVPSNLNETLDALRGNIAPSGVTDDDYIWFLRAALTAVCALCLFLLAMEVNNYGLLLGFGEGGGWNRVFLVVTSVLLGGFLALAMWQLWIPPLDDVTMDGIWKLRIHDLAAIFLIASLAVAVWSHAWPAKVWRGASVPVPAGQVAVAGRYKLIFGAMVGGPAVALGAHLGGFDRPVIFLEWYEILLFVVFWIAETVRAE